MTAKLTLTVDPRVIADFEDAVCAASAKAAGCHLITTRDPRGFKGSPCPPLTAVETLAVLRGPPPKA